MANRRIRVEEEEFVISQSGAALSETIRTTLDDDGVVVLSNIRSRTFPMIIAYLETHAAVDLSDEEKWSFDREFASGMDIDFLEKLIIDAYYLKIQGLIDVLAHKMYDVVKIKSANWTCRSLADEVQTPKWKEQYVRTMTDKDWAAEDVRRRHRKRLKDLEEQAEKIKIQ
ncbi:hypothetical protein CASFOL_020840 [Castilleja foliolosa]|uniref:SKP1 component POZ domain-containing protein n=1 Tax=Castilleja foliolosa TaxID=1961234 RepID=A0ABD3D1Z3_9LAMI